MSGIQGSPFRVILLAATILTLFATAALSADIKTLRKEAEAGDAESQFKLSVMYDKGQDVPQDSVEAFKWLVKAVNQDFPRAQFKLGLIYFLAAQNTKKQAEAGDEIARANLGFTQAVNLFQKAAEQGESEAQHLLGAMYHDGEGVPQDYSKAFMWYRKAAEQGMVDAQFNLGFAYENGEGVPQDNAEAVKWFRKAAEQGHVRAQAQLGRLYVIGRGVPQDYVQSYFWLSLAASRSIGEDHKIISNARDEAANMLTPEKLMEAQRMTREWEKSHPRK